MLGEHKLTVKDSWFLNKGYKDPIVGSGFSVGDTIVICEKCKASHFRDTWNMNSKCAQCNNKTVAKTFHPKLFQYKNSRERKFNIKINDPLKFSDKVKYMNWYTPISIMVIVITLIFFGVITISEPSRSVALMNLKEYPATIKTKVVDITEKINILTIRELKISDTNPHPLSSSKINLSSKTESLREKPAHLWKRGVEGIKVIVNFIKKKLGI